LLNQSLNSKNEKKKIWNPKSTQNKKSFWD
jgi:hypothetical protein